MPGWDIHTRVYELLGLNTAICQVIDNMIDEEPPKVEELTTYVGIEISTNVKLDGRLPKHFGLRIKTEFPYIYNYILRKYGLEGARCLLIHFILDQIEDTLKKGFTHGMIKDYVKGLIEEYKEECRIAKETCIDHVNLFNEVERTLTKHIDVIIKIVEEWVKERTLSVDVLLNASIKLLNLMLRIELYLRGYRGKGGFSVNREIFVKTSSKAKHLLRQEILQALKDGRIANSDKILESINRIQQQAATMPKVTVSKYMNLIKQEQQTNKEFKELIALLNEVIKQVIKEYKEV